MNEEAKKPLTTKRVKGTKTMTIPKMDTFSTILKRENSKIKADRATRIATAAFMDFQDLVNAKIKEKFSIENELEAMADLSTSNHTTTVNRIEGVAFDSVTFVKKRAALRFNLILITQELRILQEDAPFYAI